MLDDIITNTEKFKKEHLKDDLINMLNEQIEARNKVEQAYSDALTRQKQYEKDIAEYKAEAEEAAVAYDNLIESSAKSGNDAQSKVIDMENEVAEYKKLLEAADEEIDRLKKQIKTMSRIQAKEQKRSMPKFRLPKFITVPAGVAVVVALVFAGHLVYKNSAKVFSSIKTEAVQVVSKVTAKKDPLAGMIFTKRNSGVLLVMDAYQDTVPNELWTPLTSWAKAAGFDAVVLGRVHDYGAPMLSGKYDMRVIADRLESHGVKRAIALVDNPSEFNAPFPIQFSTKGPLEIYKSSKKMASFIPLPWKETIEVHSDNFKGTLDDGQFNAKLNDFRMSVINPVTNPEPH